MLKLFDLKAYILFFIWDRAITFKNGFHAIQSSLWAYNVIWSSLVTAHTLHFLTK